MAKSDWPGLNSTGTVLTVIYHSDGHWSTSWYIGTPLRMFRLNPFVISELRRICVLFRVDERSLTELLDKAFQHPDEHQFMAL